MLEEPVEDREGQRRDVRAQGRRVEDVYGVLDALHADLRFEPVVVKDAHDGLDDVHSDLAGVVQLADGGRDVRAARPRGEKGLRGREDETHVRGDLLVAEEPHDAEAFARHRHAQDDVLSVLVELAGLFVPVSYTHLTLPTIYSV